MSCPSQKYVTALTWGHASRKLFVATGQQLHVACIEKEVPTLQALCRQALAMALRDREATSELPLPSRAKGCIRDTFTSTIQVSVAQKGREGLSGILKMHHLLCCQGYNLISPNDDTQCASQADTTCSHSRPHLHRAMSPRLTNC